MMHSQAVLFIFIYLIICSTSSKEGQQSSREHSGISSHGSNGPKSLSGSKQILPDLNKGLQEYSYASTANSFQKKDKESVKDTASSPVQSPSSTPKPAKETGGPYSTPKRAKQVGTTPNPYPKGSFERTMETRRRQRVGLIAAHARRRQKGLE